MIICKKYGHNNSVTYTCNIILSNILIHLNLKSINKIFDIFV